MLVRSGPWQGTRPMQCTWRSTSAPGRRCWRWKLGRSWTCAPGWWVWVTESFFRCFLGPSVSYDDLLKLDDLTSIQTRQPPPGWCHRSSHLCRCPSWWWWRTHPPSKMPLEVPSQGIAGWVLQAGKSFRVMFVPLLVILVEVPHLNHTFALSNLPVLHSAHPWVNPTPWPAIFDHFLVDRQLCWQRVPCRPREYWRSDRGQRQSQRGQVPPGETKGTVRCGFVLGKKNCFKECFDCVWVSS